MIDERTLLVMLILVPALLAMVSGALWHGHSPRFPGLGLWSLSMALTALGSLPPAFDADSFQGLRPLLSNLGYVPAASLFGYSVCRFVGRPTRASRWIAGTVLVYAAGAFTTLTGESPIWRIGAVSLQLLVSAGLALHALLRSDEPAGLGRHLLSAGLALLTLGPIVRMVPGWLLDTPIVFLAGPAPNVAIYLLMVNLGVLLATLGLIQLCNERIGLRLRYLASHDSLTELLTRRAFRERAEAELSRARRDGSPVALIVLDIDHFKSINDLHGHQQGDEVLRNVAASLSRTVRGHDLCSRLGGEEFGVLLTGANEDEAQATADRLRSVVRTAWPTGTVTASLGLATLSRVGSMDNLDTLYRDADSALYRAKTGGRNRVVQHGNETA